MTIAALESVSEATSATSAVTMKALVYRTEQPEKVMGFLRGERRSTTHEVAVVS